MLSKIIGIMHQSPSQIHTNKLIREVSGRLQRRVVTPRSNTPRHNASARRFNSVLSRGSDQQQDISVRQRSMIKKIQHENQHILKTLRSVRPSLNRN